MLLRMLMMTTCVVVTLGVIGVGITITGIGAIVNVVGRGIVVGRVKDE